MNRLTPGSLAAALWLAAAGLPGAQEGGRAPVRIVIPAQAAAPGQFAAQELAKYLAAMGNPKPGIVNAPGKGDIYLGVLPPGFADPLRGRDPDSFLLRSSGTSLVIYGNSPRATLYGVYGYLESLGARWYFPGPENEVVPRARVRLQGYDSVEVPSFRKRGIVVSANTAGLRDLVDFAAKARLNTVGLHPLPSEPSLSDAGYEATAKAVGPRGLAIEIERHFFGEDFCPDDQAALGREQAKLRQYLATLPGAMNDLFLWAADKYLSPCRSPKYRHCSVSDVVLWFSNEVARTLRESRPGGRLAYLAYLGTEEPPRNVKPGAGVFLEWAPIRQCFAHSFDDPACPTSRRYRESLEGYLKIFPSGEAQVLGYWLDDTLFNRSYYGRLPYNPEALKGDLAWLHRLGIRAATTFGVITGRDYFTSHASPAVLLYPRLLWDVNSQPRALVEDFCREYFGAPELSKVFDLLAEADRMVYVDSGKVQAQRANDPAFVKAVGEALTLTQSHLVRQTDPVMRTRSARLLQEVSSRFAQVGR